MQNYAIIEDGLVVNTIEYEIQPTLPIDGLKSSCIAIQSNIAGKGYSYINGVFTAPQPYPSWTLIDNVWEAPTPMPTDGKMYTWDEPTLSWVEYVH